MWNITSQPRVWQVRCFSSYKQALKPSFFRAHGDSLPCWFDSLPYWFQGNFASLFVLNYWLPGFPLSSVANHFELHCQSKAIVCLFREAEFSDIMYDFKRLCPSNRIAINNPRRISIVHKSRVSNDCFPGGGDT